MKKFAFTFIMMAVLFPALASAGSMEARQKERAFDRLLERFSMLFRAEIEHQKSVMKPAEPAVPSPVNQTEQPVVTKPVTKPVSEKPNTGVIDVRPITTKPETKPTSSSPSVVKPDVTRPVAKPDTSVVKPDASEGKVYEDMQITYWWGKVNKHREGSKWVSDPDGVSGANIDMLKTCKKWYANSIGVKEHKNYTIYDWHNRGNLGGFESTRMAYYCVQSK